MNNLAKLHSGIAPSEQISHEIDFVGLTFSQIKSRYTDFESFCDSMEYANLIEKSFVVTRNHDRSIYRIGTVVIFEDSVYSFGFGKEDGYKYWYTVDCLIEGKENASTISAKYNGIETDDFLYLQEGEDYWLTQFTNFRDALNFLWNEYETIIDNFSTK